MLKTIRRIDRSSLPQIAVLAAAIVVLLSFSVHPFAKMISRILFSGEDRAFTLKPFAELFETDSIWIAVKNTTLVSITVSVLSTAIGVPLAWLLARTDFPMKRRFRSWLCLPYAFPPYIGAIAWIFLANPTTGLLNKISGASFFNIYSFGGLVFVETSFVYTFILLTAHASLERMDSSFEEAARLSGAGPIRIFFDITLPLIRPALLSGALLALLATAASFGVPALIGSPGHLFMVTTQIYSLQKMGSMSGVIKAGALSILLLISAITTLVMNHILLSKNQFQTVSGKTSRPSLIELGRFKTPILVLVSSFLFVVFVLPLIGILISAMSHVQGDLSASNFTFSNFYRVLFETGETPRAFFNSLFLGLSAALASCLLGTLLSYFQIKTKLPGRNFVDVLASLPYATPGTVVALALILAFSQKFFMFNFSLYNTLGMLFIAYLIKYLSFSIKTTADGFRQIDDVLAEAARVSGASWLVVMRTIWLPLMKPSLVAAFFLVFMPVVSELTMSVLLTGPGLETIGTHIFQLQEYADASGGSASVLAVLVVLMIISINYLVKKLSGGRYGL